MRFAARALICVGLVASGREVMAAKSGSDWWPFSHQKEATVSQPPGVAAPSSPYLNPANPIAGPVAHEVQLPQSADGAAAAKSKSSWLHMPSLPKLGSLSTKTKKEPKKSSWAAKTPAAPKLTGPLQTVKAGANKVTSGTKTAWHKTVSALSPSSKSKVTTPPSHVAKTDVQPPFWKRMLGEKPEPQGSQTMPGFLAQKRVDASLNQTR